ncbi:unnamed protein product [Cylindrotheca closterium]|uniref:Anaphase-promoting complex subunit 11 n=1 Tax=Cylindrotheca closterium TaxID=2856 RepID=A0AAD2CSE9_9STRA|nr:unnamed protein product [Cylindrotheca closterium]
MLAIMILLIFVGCLFFVIASIRFKKQLAKQEQEMAELRATRRREARDRELALEEFLDVQEQSRLDLFMEHFEFHMVPSRPIRSSRPTTSTSTTTTSTTTLPLTPSDDDNEDAAKRKLSDMDTTNITLSSSYDDADADADADTTDDTGSTRGTDHHFDFQQYRKNGQEPKLETSRHGGTQDAPSDSTGKDADSDDSTNAPTTTPEQIQDLRQNDNNDNSNNNNDSNNDNSNNDSNTNSSSIMNGIAPLWLTSAICRSTLLNTAASTEAEEDCCCICLDSYRPGDTVCWGKQQQQQLSSPSSSLVLSNDNGTSTTAENNNNSNSNSSNIHKCHHMFHKECALQWFLRIKQTNNQCPMCRITLLPFMQQDDKKAQESSTSLPLIIGAEDHHQQQQQQQVVTTNSSNNTAIATDTSGAQETNTADDTAGTVVDVEAQI